MMVIGVRMVLIDLMMMIGMMMMIGDDDDGDDGMMMMGDDEPFATFLYHSAPVPLPPLRPLGHGGDF